MNKKDTRKDQRLLESMINKYGKEDVIRYINENFDNSFSDDESDYTDVMDRNDRLVEIKKKAAEWLNNWDIECESIKVFDDKSSLFIIDLPNTDIELDNGFNFIEELIKLNLFKIRTCKTLSISQYGGEWKSVDPKYFDWLPWIFTNPSQYKSDITFFGIKLDDFGNWHPYNIHNNLITFNIGDDSPKGSEPSKLLNIPFNIKWLFTNAGELCLEQYDGLPDPYDVWKGDGGYFVRCWREMKEYTDETIYSTIEDSVENRKFVKIPAPWNKKMPWSAWAWEDSEVPLLSLKFTKTQLQNIASGRVKLFGIN